MNNFVDSLYPTSVQLLNLSRYECQVLSVDPQSGKIPCGSPGSSVPGVRPGQMVKLTTFPPAVVEPCHSESAQQQPKQTKTWTEFQRDLEVLSNSWDDLTWVSRDWICYQWVLNQSQGGREQPTQWDCLIPLWEYLVRSVFPALCVAVNLDYVYILIPNPVETTSSSSLTSRLMAQYVWVYWNRSHAAMRVLAFSLWEEKHMASKILTLRS